MSRFLIFILLLAGCSTSKDLSQLTEEDIVISMEKEACFGTCPAYTFDVYPGGWCVFNGKSNTYKLGTHKLQLSKSKYKELISEFKDADFFQFEDYYQSDIPDLPNVSISYREKDKIKTIVGKRERPSEIHKLQFLLEQIAESKESWIVIDGTIEEKKPEFDKTKLVLQLKNGAQLSRWFDTARQNYGIRILKRMDESYDNWLVSYDRNRFDPDEIIERLKSDENVSSVDFKLIDP